MDGSGRGIKRKEVGKPGAGFFQAGRYFFLIEKKKSGSFLAAKIFCRHGRSIVFEKIRIGRKSYAVVGNS